MDGIQINWDVFITFVVVGFILSLFVSAFLLTGKGEDDKGDEGKGEN